MDQFDHLTEKDISIRPFVNSRLQELSQLYGTQKDSPTRGMAFQNLPNHMRRRVMSHNAKRLPRKLVDVHISQVNKTGDRKVSKRPCRKHRRRPSNLNKEYLRRQSNVTWLETHIWHSKRFHIGNLYGIKIPLYPNDKNFRACKRAIMKNCVIQDMSYMKCIQLSGHSSILVPGLQKHTSPQCGPTFQAKACSAGNIESVLTFFECEKYPYGAIGDISFFYKCKPIEKRENDLEVIWMWTHPAIYSDILSQLCKTFSCKAVSGKEKYTSDGTGVTIELIPLIRFRLSGPMALKVLTDGLQPIDINALLQNMEEKEAGSLHQIEETDVSTNWWVNKTYCDYTLIQNNIWKCITEYALYPIIPSGTVLGLNVIDPRYQKPKSELISKPYNDNTSNELPTVVKNLPLEASMSPILDADVRKYVSESKVSQKDFSAARSGNLLPGFNEKDYSVLNVCCLPILLIQQPGSYRRQGYGAGWDIIAPTNWGMPLWLSLLFRGAMAIGLRETMALAYDTFESPCTAILQPDSSASHKEQESSEKEYFNNYFKMPPGKRPNFYKLGIASPFKPEYAKLVQEWEGKASEELTHEHEETSFYILRDKYKLKLLQNCIDDKITSDSIHSLFTNNDINCLVPILITFVNKGVAHANAIICLPNHKDLSFSPTHPLTYDGPEEPANADLNKSLRQQLILQHKKDLKRLRRERIKQTQSRITNTSSEKATTTCSERTQVIGSNISHAHSLESLYKKQEINELFLPMKSKPKSLVNFSSRKTIGYICQEQLSRFGPHSTGCGFVVLRPLLSLLLESDSRNTNPQKRKYVLVRNPTCTKYRFGFINVAY